MKCRSCWSDKAYVREEKGLKATIYWCLALIPLKCHHCYHKFWTPRFMTWGKTLQPPKLNEPSQDKTKHQDNRATRRRAA
jgi:hypothetical protein